SAPDGRPETLLLLRDVGAGRIQLESERGGVSLPIRDQQVQRRTAMELGYELVFDLPSEAEEWNAQISLLAGHAAAMKMLEGGAGILRTMPPIDDRDVEKLRGIARVLGFGWPDSQ